MIRFCCEQCGHRISVQDEKAGRRGKCPQCNNVVIVPDKSTIIELNCRSCGRKISVPKIHAGKEGRCPNCKEIIIVPAVKRPLYQPKQDVPADDIPRLAGNDAGLTLLEVPDEYKLKEEPADESAAETAVEQEQEYEGESEYQETESADQRNLPWFIDIFLYPLSTSGLTHLGIFVAVPLLVALVGLLLPGVGFVVGVIGFFINIAISLYICWYIAECVRDSAKGGVRAPEAFAMMGLGEMWSQAQHYIGCYLIFLGPALFYSLYTDKTDSIFWLLLICGVFFFPMGLLACVMFDSIRALNPILMIGSIFSTFFQYCGLVLLIAGIVLAFRALIGMADAENIQQLRVTMLILQRVFSLFLLYIAFVVVHLLGRFYYKYQDRLNWEV